MRHSCEAGFASPLPAPPVDSSHGGCHLNPRNTHIYSVMTELIMMTHVSVNAQKSVVAYAARPARRPAPLRWGPGGRAHSGPFGPLAGTLVVPNLVQ